MEHQDNKQTKLESLKKGTTNAISTGTTAKDSLEPEPITPQVHPFANSTSKLELIPSESTTLDGINVEEEARLYDELCRTYEDETDAFSRSNTPVRDAPASSKLTKSKPKPPPRPRSIPPESIFSADIFLADNTSSSPFPLFAQNVRISGWSTVGDAAGGTGKALLSSIPVGKGAGAYVVYDVVITTREGTTMHVLKRYTAFEQLWGALKRTLPSHLLPALPSLPPKAPLARFRPAFLDNRRKLLQFWLARVLLHPEIGWRDTVREWVLS
ncbi:hypothetical protein M413DRAFT_447714 [Hebeloma cylindrosporum]|uniref:Endosomal/vacuolar adapter protein YPT35 n=1 Tax=Hebeloma cylindrosporum TaxID=76867 RepID=A0A0C3BP57_HEBCY|nr:hypothetical protein M413DRAFT_447714 [Hebeloma cylindrosporum h7]